MFAVCTNKPKITSPHHRDHQPWKRDPFHFSEDRKRTLCGINCSEWLTIGEGSGETSNDLCDRCKKKAQK